MWKALTIATLLVGTAQGSLVTIGPNGIHSAGLTDFNGAPLTGAGIGIGQVELGRPGDLQAGDGIANRNSTIDPAGVFVRAGAPIPNDNPATIQDHPEWIAGVMISTHATRTGVATGASLYSSATNPVGPDFDAEAAITAQHIATRNGGDIRAINMSFLNPLVSPHVRDGNQLLTQFVDWSASEHDVLYVIGGRNFDTAAGLSIPADTFNGMTVAASTQVGGVYRQVSTLNGFDEPVFGERTTVDLMAPGQDVEVTGLNDLPSSQGGRSIAAPHVVGTVALLQQYADERILHAPSTRWNANGNARHHEVMKAVLMNSADKIIDNGTYILPGETTPVPAGRLLGMERTVLDLNGDDWFDSEANDDDPFEPGQGGFVPLDDQMGTGHLNASRALTQFRTGEFNQSNTVDVPVIGWDYDTTTGMGDINRYRFNEELRGGSFISITIAFDRDVDFDTDAGTANVYDVNDTFVDYTTTDGPGEQPGDSVVNDLDLYFLPKFSATTGDAIAQSISVEGTTDHIFFQVPTTGEYEFWVEQHDEEPDVGTNQNYAVAWWAASASLVAQGDFDNSGTVDAADLAQWKGDFGIDNGSDADGDGDTDGADFLAWQRGLGTTSATPTAAAVPEPSAWMLCAVGLPLLRRRRTA